MLMGYLAAHPTPTPLHAAAMDMTITQSAATQPNAELSDSGESLPHHSTYNNMHHPIHPQHC
ncbi:MAG: hypothetical protein MJE68_27330 [Proteobacteria bacterium]|nr:hypothetical protein [Pseudomonadota bacterium]